MSRRAPRPPRRAAALPANLPLLNLSQAAPVDPPPAALRDDDPFEGVEPERVVLLPRGHARVPDQQWRPPETRRDVP